MSANETDISGLSIDIVLVLFLSFSAIDLGIILWRSFSDLLRSCSRKIEYIPIGNPKTSKLPTMLLTPIIDSVKSVKGKIVHIKHTFELLGYDFIID